MTLSPRGGDHRHWRVIHTIVDENSSVQRPRPRTSLDLDHDRGCVVDQRSSRSYTVPFGHVHIRIASLHRSEMTCLVPRRSGSCLPASSSCGHGITGLLSTLSAPCGRTISAPRDHLGSRGGSPGEGDDLPRGCTGTPRSAGGRFFSQGAWVQGCRDARRISKSRWDLMHVRHPCHRDLVFQNFKGRDDRRGSESGCN